MLERSQSLCTRLPVESRHSQAKVGCRSRATVQTVHMQVKGCCVKIDGSTFQVVNHSKGHA